MNDKNLFSKTILIAALAVLLVGVAYFSFLKNAQLNNERSTAERVISSNNAPAIAGEWILFQKSGYDFQFYYPKKWHIENEQENERFIVFKDEADSDIMTVDTRVNTAMIGVSYCGAFPGEDRCEMLKTESNGSVVIDWGMGGSADAMFNSPKDDYGVSFVLNKVNPNSKISFRKILSTFKFLKS